jgi:hypothetical protein
MPTFGNRPLSVSSNNSGTLLAGFASFFFTHLVRRTFRYTTLNLRSLSTLFPFLQRRSQRTEPAASLILLKPNQSLYSQMFSAGHYPLPFRSTTLRRLFWFGNDYRDSAVLFLQ